MRYVFNIVLLTLLSAITCNGQVLKGRITDESGDPVQYSTVYIQELRQGTTSNTKGDYEIKLPSGTFTVIYQSLGYAPVYATITFNGKEITRNVVLPMQYYEIPEVRITASGEDPAYIVMRKVIGLAPYYLNNVSYYNAEVYLKGNLLVNRIPRLLSKSLKLDEEEDGTSIKEGVSYMMESFNEIQYTAPDKYHQRVLSYQSTFPEEGNEISPMDFIQASFYQPVIANMAISPLSPAAFSHYNFKYLGASLQGIHTINKIQVTPKRKSQQLFEGTIYIIEDLWCLHSVDLTNENIVGKVRVQQLYIPVQDEIWLPVSHKFDIKISIVGFKADAGYGSSVKYTEVRPNTALEKPKSISTDYTGRAVEKHDTAVSKTAKKIEKILSKDELNNRDMVRLSKLIEKQSEEVSDSTKEYLEIKETSTHVIETDAGKKDSAYWSAIRPIPLTEVEKKSIRVNDSIKAASPGLRKDTLQRQNYANKPSQKNSKVIQSLKNVALGYSWNTKDALSVKYSGLFAPRNIGFNTVDGFVYGIDFRISKNWKNKHSLGIYPDAKWAFSREKLLWKVNANYKTNGLKPKEIYLKAGMTSKDISTGAGINPLLNTAYSLLLRKNYMKLYESNYISLGYKTELFNGFELDFSPGFEDRRTLENTTDFSIFRPDREYTSNIPVNQHLEPGANPYYLLRDQRHFEFVTKLTYTPDQKYKIENGNKIPMGSDWPTFNMTWEHGINEFIEFEDRYEQYDMLRLDVFKTQLLGAFSRLRWRVSTAGFLDNGTLPFYDFLNFNTQPLALQINDYEDAFMIPAFYSMASPDIIGELHIKYTTPYLLLKFLPFLSNTLMRENISLAYLGTLASKTNYTELGYSLSEIFFFGEVGIYAGFDNLKYRSIGAKAIFRFN